MWLKFKGFGPFLAALCLIIVAMDGYGHPAAAGATLSLHSLAAYPDPIQLEGPRDQQRIGVTGNYVDGLARDLSREARFICQDPAIATVDMRGIVRPIGDGQTVITVSAGGQNICISVRVLHATAEIPVSFSREIIPVLSKAGCNQGACHGAMHGRGGFRLSLRGFDPSFDHEQIVQSAEGRRIVLSDPERSILLLKPTLTMEHGGGERFKPFSREYLLLKQWLEDGAPKPDNQDPVVNSLEVWPTKRHMEVGEKQQILVRAKWRDGRSEDVTATARFDALNESIAVVTPDGLVTATGRGDTYVMVRFAGQATVVEIILPYSAGEKFPKSSQYNFVDTKLIAKWESLGLSPSALCSDNEFFRRIHLDTIGSLPADSVIKSFLADKDPDKRKKAVETVLNRPEFSDFWALKWGDLLRINRAQLNDKGMWSFYNWVRASLRDNKPIDQFVREIITAEGSTFTQGPTNFYRVAQSPQDWAENTSQIFLGIRMQCAKCHQHPFEKWSQDDYYGMVAFFVRLGAKGSQEFGVFGGEQVIHVSPSGDIGHPRKGGIVKPHPLDGPIMEDAFDRRRKLASWIVAKQNAYFARNIVNRFWGYFMGHGLVEPLDDMRTTNPPSNAPLLDALAKDFVDHGFDLKHLMRTIMNSRAYQLSSQKTQRNQADATNVYFTRHEVRRLTAEQLADAVDFATGTREKYAGLPSGTRAIQLPDPGVKSFLLDVFGRPPRQITCECERTTEPNIAQALHLLNGDFLNLKITATKGRIEKAFSAKSPLASIIEELYLVTLSRPPNPEELNRAQKWIAKAPSPMEGTHDLLWTLLNSREFLFNH